MAYRRPGSKAYALITTSGTPNTGVTTSLVAAAAANRLRVAYIKVSTRYNVGAAHLELLFLEGGAAVFATAITGAGADVFLFPEPGWRFDAANTALQVFHVADLASVQFDVSVVYYSN